MSDREDKRGRGRGPNAVRGYELAQQGRLANLENEDAELANAIEELKSFAMDMAERVDQLESDAGTGTPSDGGDQGDTGGATVTMEGTEGSGATV